MCSETAKIIKECFESWNEYLKFRGNYIGYWTQLEDTPYSKGEVNLAGWNSLDDLNRGKGKQ